MAAYKFTQPKPPSASLVRSPPAKLTTTRSVLLRIVSRAEHYPVMTASSRVPASYISTWRTGDPPSPRRHTGESRPESSLRLSRRKLNTSCNACRKSRVKCPGGVPCQRCAASGATSSCVYSFSRRRGKYRASDGVPRVESSTQADSVDHGAPPPPNQSHQESWTELNALGGNVSYL